MQEPIVQSVPKGNVFRKEDDYWDIEYEGELLRLKDIDGFGYIRHLQDNPYPISFKHLKLYQILKGVKKDDKHTKESLEDATPQDDGLDASSKNSPKASNIPNSDINRKIIEEEI